ncbi:rhodanese-like Ca-sensing receptor [Haematococcus lacustris]
MALAKSSQRLASTTHKPRSGVPVVRVAAASGKSAGLNSLTIAASIIAAAPVRAAQEPVVDSAVDSVVVAIKAAGEVIKAGVTAAQAGIQVLKEGYDIAAPIVEKAYKVASPIVGQAIKATVDAASPAIKAALPSIQDGLQSTGFNPGVVTDATSAVTQRASTAVSTATPFLTKVLQVVSGAGPVTLAEYALGLAALTYLVPLLLGGLGGSFRGFAGEVAPAAALDSLANESDVLLIDIRSSKEKEASGVPDLPTSAASKALEVEYASTDDKRLRALLRDPTAMEAQITALQVAALKKISKGTKLVLLDRYGPAARTVAKELGRRGYGKVFVVSGGFDGRGGWVQSKLQIKPAASVVNAAPPSLASTVFARTTRALPAPKSA